MSTRLFKFDDDRVTKEEAKRATEEQYGGEELYRPNPELINTPDCFKFTNCSNAYMLVYIRESVKDKIICNVDEKDIAEDLRVRLKKEQEEKEKKRKEKAEAHLYTIIKVACDKDLADQIGKDIYFDLVDHDKVWSFRVQKQQPFIHFKEEVAKEFGIPVQFQRFWLWAKRKNQTYRPNRHLTPSEESHSVGQLMEVSSQAQSAELKLFLEAERGLDHSPLPLHERKEDDILLFFKLYDPEKKTLRYVGRSFEKAGGKPADSVIKLNKMAGFLPDTELELYKEIMFDPAVKIRRITKISFCRSDQFKDGDIICFQRALTPGEETRYKYPHVRSFLEYMGKRQVSSGGMDIKETERMLHSPPDCQTQKQENIVEVFNRTHKQTGVRLDDVKLDRKRMSDSDSTHGKEVRSVKEDTIKTDEAVKKVHTSLKERETEAGEDKEHLTEAYAADIEEKRAVTEEIPIAFKGKVINLEKVSRQTDKVHREKHKERFRRPMNVENPMNKKPQDETTIQKETDELKQCRPPRKRKWGSG